MMMIYEETGAAPPSLCLPSSFVVMKMRDEEKGAAPRLPSSFVMIMTDEDNGAALRAAPFAPTPFIILRHDDDR